jgi:hypothetical protein
MLPTVFYRHILGNYTFPLMDGLPQMSSRLLVSQSIGLLMVVSNRLSWISSSLFFASFELIDWRPPTFYSYFCRAARAHTGVYLAARISECLSRLRNTKEGLFSITVLLWCWVLTVWLEYDRFSVS